MYTHVLVYARLCTISVYVGLHRHMQACMEVGI